MSLVLPILLAAVIVGLFARRITPAVWLLMAGWILAIISYHYFSRA